METVVNSGTPKAELNDSVVTEYKNGDSLKIIAQRNNVNISTISRFLKNAGVELRGRGRPKKVKEATLGGV